VSDFFVRQSAAYRNDLNRSAAALIGIAQGILCDAHLNDAEVRFLDGWLTQNNAIANAWPGNVVHARVQNVLADGIITSEEREHLIELLQQLVGGKFETLAESRHVSDLAFDHGSTVTIPRSTFCLTGEFVFATRAHCESVTEKRGGIVSRSVTKKVNYVVVGGLGSSEWKHGSYGTKIAKAVEFRGSGIPIRIVQEDQWAGAL